MEKTEIMECLRLISDGSGVGYLDGKATFVPGLLPGETGEIQVYQRKSRYQKARLIKVLSPSQSRQDPPCSVYEICGGCQLQHLDYGGTLAWKQQWVADALQRIGNINTQVNPVLGMDYPWRYRNKARLHRDQSGNLGYHREKSNQTVVFEDCLLLSEVMNEWIQAMNTFLQQKIPSINNVIFRQAPDKKGLVFLEGLPDDEEMLNILKKELEKRQGNQSERFEGIEAVWGLDSSGLPVPIWGEREMEVTLQGLYFQVSPLAFLQVNPIMTEKLYSLVLDWAELTGKELVWDLYSGIGTLTLALARKAGKVIGIEENPFAVEDAKRNSVSNNLDNAEFITGKAEDLMESLSQGITGNPDLVVLDPPRAGLAAEVVDVLLQAKPKRIIYVSCAPGTLARDAGKLVRGGYEVGEVQPVDMFPWTEHVETITRINRA